MVALTPMTVVEAVAEEELLKEEALVVITLVVMVGTQRYKVPIKVILWLVEEEKAQALTLRQRIVQNMAEVEEVLVEAVVTLTTVDVPCMVQEAVQAQGKVLPMEGKAGLGVFIAQEAVVLREDEQPTAVMVRHGLLAVVMVAVVEVQDNQELMVVMVAMGEPQAVEEEVLEDKVTGEVQEEVQAVMEEEGKLGFFLGKYL